MRSWRKSVGRGPLRASGKSPGPNVRLPKSRAAGYGAGPKKPAKYKCTKCSFVYEEPEAGGTICPNCGNKYVTWIGPEEFIAAAEAQDKALAEKAARGVEEAARQSKSAGTKAKKDKVKRKNARKARKRK